MVTVGVSGHRTLLDHDAIKSAVDEALEKILVSFRVDSLQVISPLAEGADRLVAIRAKETYAARLVVPLPLNRSEYMHDFDSVNSKFEFLSLLEQADQVIDPPKTETREVAYLAAGLYVLDNSDVLIAVWDGAPARGTGGTAEIVAGARRRMMPVAWVRVPGREAGLSLEDRKSSGEVHVLYERFPAQSEDEAGDR